VVDVFGKRYSSPEEAVDLIFDTKAVLPKFAEMTTEWCSRFGAETFSGTHTE
jgi:hypothetical protein